MSRQRPDRQVLPLLRHGEEGALEEQEGRGKACKKGRTCFECRAVDHIAAARPVRTSRVAAGGLERLDKPDDPMGGSKDDGKKGGKKGDKGKGKVTWTSAATGKGVWTAAGDHGGSWIPTRAQLKSTHGGLPYPTAYQYTRPWHPEGKGVQRI